MSAACSASDPDGSSDRSLSKTRLRTWLRLLKASRLIEEELRFRLRRECDWTMSRFDVMAALARVPDGLKMSEISQRLRVSSGNITSIVDKLAKDNLAQRVALPGDRRAYLVQLTPQGKDVFADIARQHEAWVDELWDAMSEEDAQALSGLLDILQTSHERHRRR